MDHDSAHAACVDAWLARAGGGLSREQQFTLFQNAFTAVWVRAHRTLGDVTLTAISERVLYTAAEQHPFVSLLQVDASGPQCEPLHQGLPDVEPDQLASGLRLVLVDFLTVLGNLTAEILTPALHAELSKVALEDGGVNANESQAGPPNNESNGEGSQP